MKERGKLYLCFLLAVSISLFLGGCASKFENIITPDNFLQKKNVRIGLIWQSQFNMCYPEGPEYTGKHIILGTTGLMDIAIARSSSEKIIKELNNIKLKDLMREHYLNVFQRAFENKNFIVKIKPDPYCHKKFRLGTNEYCTNALEPKTFELKKVGDNLLEYPIGCMIYDYKPVIANLGVDYLLVIDLMIHGTARSYYGMIPTSPPKGNTALVSYLINGKTEEVISQHVSSVVEPVKGEWDEPPGYANLMKAARTSFEIAINEIYIDIFKQAP